MKRGFAALLALALLCAPPAWAERTITGEEMDALTRPLTGLLACELGADEEYPKSDEIDDEYARTYLFFMANIFYPDRAEERQTVSDESFSQFARLTDAETDDMLYAAFGGLFSAEDLAADGRMLLKDGSDFLVGVSDGYPLTVAYAGEENPAFSPETEYVFSYVLADGDTPREGRFSATLDADDEDGTLYVTGLQTDAAAQSIACNWKSADGDWFSMMEDGSIFLFDADSNYLSDGAWTLSEEKLSVAVGEKTAQGAYDGETIKIALPGNAEKVYEREVF